MTNTQNTAAANAIAKAILNGASPFTVPAPSLDQRRAAAIRAL